MSFFAICIEGTKGAGKTTTIAGLKDQLMQLGYEVDICAPFTDANRFAQEKGYRGAKDMISASKADNQAEINFILEAIQSAREVSFKKAKETEHPVVLIYDRGWMTIRPHLYGGRWYAEDKNNSEAINKIWEKVLDEVPPTAFLHASFEVTKARRSRPDTLGGLETEDKLRHDIEGRRSFAKEFRDKIVLTFDMSGETPQHEVIQALSEYVQEQIHLPCVPS